MPDITYGTNNGIPGLIIDNMKQERSQTVQRPFNSSRLSTKSIPSTKRAPR
jgi:hypothetical protein